jgi:DNA-binding NtrC family response regulator
VDGGKSKAQILIVASDGATRAATVEQLRKQGYAVESVAGGNKALARFDELLPDLVLIDVEASPAGNGSGHHGAALIARLCEQDADLAVVAMIGADDVEASVSALGAGASHYLTKPINATELSLVVERELARRRQRAEVSQLRVRLTERYRVENIVGSSAPMQAVFKIVAQVAVGRSSALLTGEAGTGKALIAAVIHEKSPRAHGPFVRFTCRGYAEAVLDSELFGHEQASAASAAGREGRLVQAQGGTLLLEEVDALPAALQVKLRRFLETGRFERAEGDQPIAADVRVIASSTRDLPQLVADGQLREDLFRRLAAVHIEMPALRDRPSDVPPLALHFLRVYAGARGMSIAGFDDEALERLGGYAWPGNVRELEDVVERAVAACRGPRITGVDLPPSLHVTTARAAVPIPGSTLDAIERYAILRTLEATSGSTTRAAEILGISVRKVQYKLQEYQSTTPSAMARPAPSGSAPGKRN